MKQPDAASWRLPNPNLRSGLYTIPGYRGVALAPQPITDQITDQNTPYCDELSHAVSNDIRMLAVTQRRY